MARVTRIVESQEQIASLSLVDNIEEQALLEQILEDKKPQAHAQASDHHYLIHTPFRYPPLKYGSRFGERSRRGIFYASMNIDVALAETAYYRFYFLSAMAEPYKDTITNEYSNFWVNINTFEAIALQSPPFDQYHDRICSKLDYSAAQRLGSDMRDDGIMCASYPSVRTQGINVAVFDIQAIRSQYPQSMNYWLCHYQPNEETIAFISKTNKSERVIFRRDDFLLNGQLPTPVA